MAKLYPKFSQEYLEIPVDPHSPFWLYHAETDPLGNPLDLMVRAEEGDEIAMAVMSGTA